MKNKVFILALALTSLTAFAQSNNYAQSLLNDDGTTTIVGPRFSSSTETALPLSASSDSNGVCRLYGFDFALGELSQTEGDVAKTVVINGTGRFDRYISYSSTAYNKTIRTIVCAKNNQTLVSSTRVKPRQNDDGTLTLLNPETGFYLGNVISKVSAASSADGLCRYFGLGKALPNSMVSEGDSGSSLIVINNLGAASGLTNYSSNSYNRYVKSIICEATSRIPRNDEMYETVQINRRELMRMEALIRNLEEENARYRGELSNRDQKIKNLEERILKLENDLATEIRVNGGAKRKLERLKSKLKELSEESIEE
jgi:hypothetical protein